MMRPPSPSFKTAIAVTACFVVCMVLIHPPVTQAQHAGLSPLNSESFQTGDWRHFRPHYIGESTRFIRPRFTMNSSTPISGNHSLQWRSGEEEHEWIKLSNAFHLALPTEVSMDVRVQSRDGNWSFGLQLMENYQRYTGVRIAPDSEGRITVALLDNTGSELSVPAASQHTYRLTVERHDNDVVRIRVADASTREVLARMEGFSSVTPEALAMYVKTGAGSSAVIDFDNIQVQAAPFRMRSGVFTRAPRFVVLPQLPDVAEDQGNWVGGQTTIKKDGEYLMWYRRRDNIDRGKGYGFARSRDGLHWVRHQNNPVFTYDPERFSSSEKITVRVVDGTYHAWYAVNAPGNWYTAWATSQNGIDWEQHGVVIDDAYAKDADIIYHEGLFYLYAIRDNDQVAVYTSENGQHWELHTVIPMGVHRHVAATYVKRTGEFHLYISGGFAGVSKAVSTDGIHFGPFVRVMQPSRIGLDDWDDAGVTYLSFVTDKHGKIEDDRALPVYYQARNNFGNNIPGWLFHGSERVVLAGRYEGLYKGIPATIHPEGGYLYHRFPFEVPRVEGLEIHASFETDVHVQAWDPLAERIGYGHLEVKRETSGHSGRVRTLVQFELDALHPGADYELLIAGQIVQAQTADTHGRLLFSTVLASGSAPLGFEVRRKNL